MELTPETFSYSAFDISYELFPADGNFLYDLESKEGDKLHHDFSFDSVAVDGKFRQTSFLEAGNGSPLFNGNNYTESIDPSKLGLLNVQQQHQQPEHQHQEHHQQHQQQLHHHQQQQQQQQQQQLQQQQYYAYRTSQFQPNSFDSDVSTVHSESSSPLQDSSSAASSISPSSSSPSSSSSSSIGRVFVCSYCSKTFTSEKYLSMHVSLHNVPSTGGESDSAQLIVKEFKSQGICPIERTKAKGGSKAASWTCKICLKTFAQNSNYKNHIRTHSNERPFVCNVCSIGFKERYHLKKHVLFVHTSEMKEKCGICDKRFKDSTAVRAHERTHSENRPYVCSRCGKAFKTSECLWHHENRSKACVKNYLKNNPGSDPKPESKRGRSGRSGKRKEFDGRQNLGEGSPELLQLENVKVEQNSNFYSDQNVSSQSNTQFSANGGTSSSDSIPPYQNFVGMTHTSQYSSEKRQDDSGDMQKSDAFPSMGDFKGSHCSISSVQEEENEEEEERPFRCHECHVGFKTNVHLKKHNLYKHTDEYPCECRVCGKRFKDSSAVRLHERIHSNERPFGCRCGKTFKTRENLWGHQHRGPCEVFYESEKIHGSVGANGGSCWQSNCSDYFGANTDRQRGKEAPLTVSQEIVTAANPASDPNERPRTSESICLARLDNNSSNSNNAWKMAGEVSHKPSGGGQMAPEQHPSIPTAIVVPMKRIPSSMFSQQVSSPNKKQFDAAFLPPFEIFNDTIHTDVQTHSHNPNFIPESIRFESGQTFQQKLPDIQCMLQSFPQNYSLPASTPSTEAIRQSNQTDPHGNFRRDYLGSCYQKSPGLMQQPVYGGHVMEDLRYGRQFSITYNF